MTAQGVGRVLIGLGLAVAAMGVLVWLLGALPRLPGDIYIQRRGFTLYVPVVTALLLSLVLTVLLNLFFRYR